MRVAAEGPCEAERVPHDSSRPYSRWASSSRLSIGRGASSGSTHSTLPKGYAQHVLAETAVLLLRAALQDESNVHFVMVSDTSIPLYPPQVVWAQLMSEQRSRLDACTTRRSYVDMYRWSAALSSEHFGKQHWRKSSQWFTLTRPAALLVVADSHVRELFRRHCYTNFTRGRPMCVSDEHYMASLMASYGLENATDCKGRCQQPAQQRTYAGLASRQRSLRLLQEGGQRLAALKSGNSAEGAAADAARDVGAARWMVSAGYVPLGSHCPLFARKFTAGVVNETLAMALSCAGIGLGSWCAEQQWLALVHG
ncbi:hypothetical protein OEZ86_003980 [Tetradesmus obliquus]|nr:hypothetical protein OEZ86_003980 [Tetradesmus obliquus]